MVTLWFIMIPIIAASGYFTETHLILRRNRRQYAELEVVLREYYRAWDACWNDLWSRASVQERGWLTEPQRAELDAINERIGTINVQMAKCAEEM